MSIRDVFICLVNIIIIILITESFIISNTVVTSPLPPNLNSAALFGLMMVTKRKLFCNKRVCDEVGFSYFAPKRLDLSHSAMLTVLPDDKIEFCL